MSNTIFFVLILLLMASAVAVYFAVKKLLKNYEVAIILAIVVIISGGYVIDSIAKKQLGEKLVELTQDVELKVGELVTVNATPDSTMTRYVDGQYQFLGESDIYTVTVKDMDVQNILVGNKVIYRNTENNN